MNKIPIEVSARHAHLSPEAVEKLFGKGYKLTPARFLTEPRNFIAKERVDLMSHSKIMENVAIVGPSREITQIELSFTDCRELGIKDIEVRDSGEINLAGTPGITIKSGLNQIHLDDGVVAAWRHIHMNPTEALNLSVSDGQLVKVRISGPRAITFENVLIRVQPDFVLGMQLDTDEANACGIGLSETPLFGELVR